MVPDLRARFNHAFHPDLHRRLVDEATEFTGAPIGFRLSETPLFLSDEMVGLLLRAGDEHLRAVTSPGYLATTDRVLPPGLSQPAEDHGPMVVCIDYAVALDGNGNLVPRLIELNGFPTVLGFIWLHEQLYRSVYPIDWGTQTAYFGGLSSADYVRLLARVLLGDTDPEQVVLLEIEPEKQQTNADFFITEKLLGIPTVCATKVIERNGRLSYRAGRREIPIKRIYNRVLYDDLMRRRDDVAHLFFGNQLDVTWIGHPSWFLRIGKFALPSLDSEFAPKARFVSDLIEIPPDPENYVLKPLFSFGGQGVVMAPTAEQIRTVADPENYLLQERVDYAAALATPYGDTKAEVRVVYMWDGEPKPITTYIRLSRGAMIGVNFNKESSWSGSSIAFHSGAL